MRKIATNSAMKAKVSRKTLMNWNAVESRSAMSALRCVPVCTLALAGSIGVTLALRVSCDTPGSARTTTPVTTSAFCSMSFCAVGRSNSASVLPSLPEIPRVARPTTIGRTVPPGVSMRTLSPIETPAEVAVDSSRTTWSGPTGALPLDRAMALIAVSPT